MFEEGLPVRGAIAFGDYVFVQNVFAGKPIVDAYTLAESLDLAACAIHPTAENEFKTLLAFPSGEGSILAEGLVLVRYPLPVKQSPQEFLCLNHAWPTLKGYTPLKDRKDPRGYVEEQFAANNKTIPPNALSKVENTEKFLRFLADRFPNLFDRDP